MKVSLALTAVPLVALLFLVPACSSSDDAPASADATGASGASGAKGKSGAAPSGDMRSTKAGTLGLDVPTSWTEEAPTNSMRAGQFSLGDDGTTLVVFFFGVGGGGGVEDNMARWIGQVSQPDGTPSADVAERSSETRGAITLHHVDVSGTYGGGMSGGGGSNWRFLGAVVECAGGPFFFKLTGPAASVAAAKADYEAVLASLRPGA